MDSAAVQKHSLTARRRGCGLIRQYLCGRYTYNNRIRKIEYKVP
ncbi:hypothetical protein [Olavius algarvensis spirochete endosymbiont]|nr:hypothetical protein [Olavius algarvensis spirochete endosymbiont]